MYTSQDPEPNGRVFGHTILEELPPIKVSQVQAYAKPVHPQNCDSDDILKQQCNDELCNQIKQNLGLPKYQNYKLEDGLLYKNTKIKDQLFDAVVIPSKLQNSILTAAHENLGHMCITKTYAFLCQAVFLAWHEETDCPSYTHLWTVCTSKLMSPTICPWNTKNPQPANVSFVHGSHWSISYK